VKKQDIIRASCLSFPLVGNPSEPLFYKEGLGEITNRLLKKFVIPNLSERLSTETRSEFRDLQPIHFMRC